jgi:hypothetical protein
MMLWLWALASLHAVRGKCLYPPILWRLHRVAGEPFTKVPPKYALNWNSEHYGPTFCGKLRSEAPPPQPPAPDFRIVRMCLLFLSCWWWSCGFWRLVFWEVTNDSEGRICCIFRVEYSETLVSNYKTARRYNRGDHSRRPENFWRHLFSCVLSSLLGDPVFMHHVI